MRRTGTADRKTALEVLQHMLGTVSDQIHTILTDTGLQVEEQPRNRNIIDARRMRFGMICEANGIDHRRTKPDHPRSSEDPKTILGIVLPRDGQVEPMNGTIKDATVQRCDAETHDQLRTHLADVLAACNIARWLKTLHGLSHDEDTCKTRTSEPETGISDPMHQMPGLNT